MTLAGFQQFPCRPRLRIPGQFFMAPQVQITFKWIPFDDRAIRYAINVSLLDH